MVPSGERFQLSVSSCGKLSARNGETRPRSSAIVRVALKMVAGILNATPVELPASALAAKFEDNAFSIMSRVRWTGGRAAGPPAAGAGATEDALGALGWVHA